jgi:predicted phosphate transport protein (TIGR00153 family)
MFRFFTRRKGPDFLKMLLEQAQLTREGLQAFVRYAKSGDEAQAAQVGKLERDEDELRRVLIDELNRTFVTPIDREDIFALSRAVDDMLDYAYTTIDEMQILGVKPNEFVSRLAEVLCEAADEIYLAISQLRDHPNVANEHVVRAKTLENVAESVYREAVRHLFERVRATEDVVQVLKLREVYRHLSNAADRGDEAANIVGDIIVKMS